MTQSELSEQLWILDARIGRMIAELPDIPRVQQIAAQLARSATEFAPQYDASMAAGNRADLIEALDTSLTDLRATRSCLRVLLRNEPGRSGTLIEMIAEAQQLCRFLSAALRAAKNARSPLPIAPILHEAELAERLWMFDAQLARMIPTLLKTGLGRRVAGALRRAGKAFAPRYDESAAARSRTDLVSKLDLALEELRTTRSSLRFIGEAGLLPAAFQGELLHEAAQLCRILGSHRRRVAKRLSWTQKKPAAPARTINRVIRRLPTDVRTPVDALCCSSLAAPEVAFASRIRRSA